MLNAKKDIHGASCAVVMALTVFALPASAQTTYADEVNRLEAQINLMQKKEQLNAARARLVDPRLTSLPQVVAVMGLDGQYQARLLLSSGAVHTYSEGDQVSPTMKISVITGREVIVAIGTNGRNSKPILSPLRFVVGASQQSGPPGVPGMPAPQGNVAGQPLPEGLLPPPPSVNFGAMPTPIQAPRSVGRAPSQTPQQGAGASVQQVPAAAAPAVATSQAPAAVPPPARPDQDLLEAR